MKPLRAAPLLLLALLCWNPAAAADLQSMLGAEIADLEKADIPKEELTSLYSAHNYQPLWTFHDNEQGVSTTAAAFIASLQDLITYHGLNNNDYPMDGLKNIKSVAKDEDRFQLDILVTASVLRLLHDLHGDSIDFSDDYIGWFFQRANVDVGAQLASALQNGTVNDLITNMTPKSPTYHKLAQTLKIYQGYASKGEWARIDGGAPLRPGDHSPRVLQLRARLEAENYLQPATPESDVFDGDLQKALTSYQLHNAQEPDGHAGEKTIEALNTPLATRIEQIRANMERWRHMPEDFPPDRAINVNIADATIAITEGGKEIYRGLVVIGKVDRKTPFISSIVRSMIVNPVWHVPTKIAQKDILPKLRKDPHYLEKLGFVIAGRNSDPYGAGIDWKKMPEHSFNFQLQQAPGDHNSLGHLKFDFDNDFAVYMHGTPHQELFDKPQRNYSSGCIRLRDPDDIGEILLKDTPGHWTADKIETEIDSNKTKWVTIKNPMPIYVTYWTVFVDTDGSTINFRKDVYDYDHIMEETAPQTP